MPESSKSPNLQFQNQPFEVRVEKMVYGGDGLGHHEGHTVFVPFVLPDERVSVEPLERRKKFIRGRLGRVITASPNRMAPPCPYFGVCGGCHYQHIPYELQLEYKAAILRETLSRLGRIAWDGPIVSHPSPAYGYRNRAQWKIALVDGKLAIGYYQAGSRKLCPVSECPISSPLLVSALQALSALLAARKLPDTLLEAEAFANDAHAKLFLNLSFDKFAGSAEKIAQTLRSELPAMESLLLHDRKSDRFELQGPGHISYRAGDRDYRVGHLSFFQVNRFLSNDLAAIVMGEAHGRLALDLFAGVGLFTVPLAHRFERVIGVESNAAAVRDLEANLQASGAASPAARESEVETFLARWRERPDFVVLDPPRSGVPAQALSQLVKLAPGTIAYLSCDPATLARDLALLVGSQEKPAPYLISEVHLVDIFPQTYHMEALVRLSRRE
jgi:23S rRNA (uracil1939-C5)-methyltransferase